MNKQLKIKADHDGTFSPFDIGKNYLPHIFPLVYAYLGLEDDSYQRLFVQAVSELRETPSIPNQMLGKVLKENGDLSYYNPEIHYGVELGLMSLMECKLAEDYSLLDKLNEEIPSVPEDVLKQYAMKMLTNPPENLESVHICSAGVEDCVRKPYEKIESEIYLEVKGTRIEKDEKTGTYVIHPMGRHNKKYEVRRVLNGGDGKGNFILLSFGDSAGDSEMLIETYNQRGIPVSVGKKAEEYATLVVSNEDNFLTAYKVALALSAIVNSRNNPERAYREALIEAEIEDTPSYIHLGKLKPRKIDEEIYRLVKKH